MIVGTALSVAFVLIVSGMFVYFEYFKEEEVEKEEIPPKREIDNRISPLEKQGLFLEINRVRHRGLLEELTRHFNRKWRDKPSFYVVTRSEGVEYSTKDIGALGTASENYFVTWDTMFMEHKKPV